MAWIRRLIGAGAVLAFAAGVALARPTTSSKPVPVTIPNSRAIEFTSKLNGHRYLLEFGLPTTPPPADGYPVFYVLDSEWYFGSAVEAARRMAPNVVVVGVGYPQDDRWVRDTLKRHAPLNPMFSSMAPRVAAIGLERNYDMSLPGSDAVLQAQALPGTAYKSSGVGHVDDFLRIIETEVKPLVRATVHVNDGDQAIFGHSIGGEAVLRALFTEPTAFRTFIAASPAIWWSDNALLGGETAFDKVIESGAAHPRVLITVGALEETSPHLPPVLAANQAKLDSMYRDERMIGNACDLVKRLKALHAAAPSTVANCAVFPHQDHAAAPWPSLGLGMEFAFPRR
jgi:predicted alpha/beta superfamily hydrolase